VLTGVRVQAAKETSLKVKKMNNSSVQGVTNVVTSFSGSSFRDYIFTRLCGNLSIKWPQFMVVPLITTIKDLHPDDKELKMTVSGAPSLLPCPHRPQTHAQFPVLSKPVYRVVHRRCERSPVRHRNSSCRSYRPSSTSSCSSPPTDNDRPSWCVGHFGLLF
jgi:hypothetical protein